MAWTTPRTWVTGEVVTAVLLNAQIKGNSDLAAAAIMTTAGDIIYASAANTPARLAKDANATRYLANTGTSNVPAWNQVNVANGITGTMTVGNGGTGATTLTDGGVLLGNGTSGIVAMGVLADGEFIVGDGTTDPVAESGATLRTSIGVGTTDSPQVTGIELGHATDSTITRGAAGLLEVEGVRLVTVSATQTLTNKTLITPALGEPSALVATNASGTAASLTAGNVTTNANLTGHVTSIGNAAVLGSFTSAQLATALTNETGTGLAVFNGSPVLTTPTIGSFANAGHTHADAAGGSDLLATAAETTTGTSTAKAVTPDALAGSVVFGTRYVQMVIADFTADIAEGNGKFYLHIPAGLNGMDLVEVHAKVITVGSGSTVSVMVHNLTDTTDMLSTAVTIDDGELDSKDAAAAVAIDTGADDVVTDDVLRIDVDGNGGDSTIAKGLIVTLGFRLP